MPIDINTFWNTQHIYNPPLTDEIIAMAEAELEVRLPTELLQLLRLQNGGYTTGYVFPTKEKNSWASDHVPFDELAGINLDRNNFMFNFFISSKIRDEWLIPDDILLLSGDGHFFITLDYRRYSDPVVSWIDFECDEDVQVAASFSQFLEGLVKSSEFVSADSML